MEGILVPLGFFAMVAAIVIVPRYLKSLERQKLQETLRASIEKGAELPPEVVQALTSDAKPAPSPYRPALEPRLCRRRRLWSIRRFRRPCRIG